MPNGSHLSCPRRPQVAAYARFVRQRTISTRMRELLRTASLSQAESLRVALEGEGIASISNASLAGVPPGAITLAVDEADFERAQEILRDLQATPSRSWAERPRVTRTVIVAALMSAILITALC